MSEKVAAVGKIVPLARPNITTEIMPLSPLPQPGHQMFLRSVALDAVAVGA